MKINLYKAEKNGFLKLLYKKLALIPVLRDYLLSLKRLAGFVKPGREEMVEEEAVKLFFSVYGISAILFVMIWTLFKLQIFYVVLAAVIAALWCRYFLHWKLGRMEKIMLKDFNVFINLFYNKFHSNHGVEESVLDAMGEMESGLEYHLEQIYNLLLQEDMMQIKEYKYHCLSRYFYSFLMYCYLFVTYGDGKKESEYAFLKALNILEQQIYMEILKRERLAGLFSGLVPITLIPVLFLNQIEKWGIYNLPQLKDYYNSSYGRVVCYILLLVTAGSCEFIIWLKEDIKCSFGSCVLLGKIADFTLVRMYFQKWTQNHPKKVQIINEKLRSVSARVSLEEFCTLRIFLAVIFFMLSMIIFYAFCQVTPMEFIFLFCITIAVSVLAYHLPVLYLWIRCCLLEEKMEQEVIDFCGILLIFSNISKADVLIVLEWLEAAAVIFQPSFSECLDKFSNDSAEALETLKSHEVYKPIQKITEALISSEEIGLEHSLGTLAVEQQYLLYKQKQNNEIRAENKGALGKVVAFMPMIFTVLLYLILPFVLESLVQLRLYVDEMHIM